MTLSVIACVAIGGIALGGAYSLRQQRAPLAAVVVAAALGVVATGAGVLLIVGALRA